MQRRISGFALSCLLPILSTASYGCGSTLRDAPQMSVDKLRWRGFKALSPSNVQLEIIDARSAPYREHSDELTQALTRQLSQILGNEGVLVDAKSPHKLTLTIRTVDESLRQGFPEERCVSVSGRLERESTWFAEGEGFGCHSVRHVVGITLGGNISEAYQVATQALLNNLAQALDRIERSNPDAFKG